MFQLLALKSFFAVLITFLYIRKDLIRFLITDIERDQWKYIFYKTCQGISSYFLLYYGIQNLPLVIVSLINNTVPIIIAILSFLILSEGLRVREVFALLLSFGGIIIYILGKDVGPGTEGKSLEIIPILS